jgi:hypothetical protein
VWSGVSNAKSDIGELVTLGVSSKGRAGSGGVESSPTSVSPLWGTSWSAQPPLPAKMSSLITIHHMQSSFNRWKSYHASKGQTVQLSQYKGNAVELEYDTLEWKNQASQFFGGHNFLLPNFTLREFKDMRILII